jgi:class 3 adenylate cyclase
VLAEFASVVDAVRCAVEIQRAMTDRDLDLAEERRSSRTLMPGLVGANFSSDRWTR